MYMEKLGFCQFPKQIYVRFVVQIELYLFVHEWEEGDDDKWRLRTDNVILFDVYSFNFPIRS